MKIKQLKSENYISPSTKKKKNSVDYYPLYRNEDPTISGRKTFI